MEKKEVDWTKNNVLKLFGELLDDANDILERKADILGIFYSGNTYRREQNRPPIVTKEQLRLSISILEDLGMVRCR